MKVGEFDKYCAMSDVVLSDAVHFRRPSEICRLGHWREALFNWMATSIPPSHAAAPSLGIPGTSQRITPPVPARACARAREEGHPPACDPPLNDLWRMRPQLLVGTLSMQYLGNVTSARGPLPLTTGKWHAPPQMAPRYRGSHRLLGAQSHQALDSLRMCPPPAGEGLVWGAALAAPNGCPGADTRPATKGRPADIGSGR